MRAMVYEGNGQRRWREVEDAKLIDDTDVVVRIEAASICGADVHLVSGDLPGLRPGRILGHEAVGTVTEVGFLVRNVDVGDRVLISSITSCGLCAPCRSGNFGRCSGGGGWLLGRSIDGVHAEYARIPHADFSCHLVPDSVTNEQVLSLAEMLPTAYELGIRNTGVGLGAVVAIVGAGPIGLSILQLAVLSGATTVAVFDPLPSRLYLAQDIGASIVGPPEHAHDLMRTVARDDRPNVVIEAAGTEAAIELAASLVPTGGRLAVVGAHGHSRPVQLGSLWDNDVTVSMGRVDTSSIPLLMRLVESGQIDGQALTTHRFLLDQAMAAYDMFCDADRYEACEVVMRRV